MIINGSHISNHVILYDTQPGAGVFLLPVHIFDTLFTVKDDRAVAKSKEQRAIGNR